MNETITLTISGPPSETHLLAIFLQTQLANFSLGPRPIPSIGVIQLAQTLREHNLTILIEEQEK